MSLTSDKALLSEPTARAAEHRSLEAVYAYIQAATAANTRRAYRSDVAHFLAWGGSIPTDDTTIARYLAEHAKTLSIATLCRRLSAQSKETEKRHSAYQARLRRSGG